MVDGGGREKRAKGGRRRGQLYSARPTRGVPTGAEGFQGGEGWTARERRAIYGVVGGGGGWLRDWSKRLVAGADKKLHPKKVSPSPPRPPPRASPTPTRFFSFFFFSLAPMSLRSLSTSCRSLKPPPPRPSLNSSTARQASQTSGIHYSCRPTPLDGGTLKIVRKQIRPAPTPPPPTGVSTRRRASYAIARNDARLIGTTRDIFSLPPLSLFFSLSSPSRS